MKPYSRTRARDTDRESAVAVVQAAFADGQLDRTELDVRVSRLQQARTFADLDAQLHDLQRPGQSLWRAPVAGGPVATNGATPRWKPVALGVVGVLIVAGLLLPGMIGGDGPDETRQQVPVPAAEEEVRITNPHTPQGWDEFLAALEEKTGDTVVFEAYPRTEYISVTVPVAESGERAISYTWDGEWSEGRADTSNYSRKDLSRIDPRTFAAAMARVSGEVEEPEEQDISIFGNVDGHHADACYTASASNRFGESEMVYFTCGGAPIPD